MLATAQAKPDLSGAKSAAGQLIAYYGITTPANISLEDIAWERGIEVRYGPLDGVEAWLVRKGDRGIVRVNDSIPELGKKRFALGHEIGHWERHRHLSQSWLCTSADIHAYRGSVAELEANAFASSLLMPQPLFQPQLQRGISLDVIRDLADEFGTSLTATAVRAVELADEDCYAVFSRGGVVRWWQRNERRSEQWIPKQHPIDMDVPAWSCERTPSYPEDAQQVPIRAWFPTARYTHGLELWEQSVYLSQYGTVLTLLCLF